MQPQHALPLVEYVFRSIAVVVTQEPSCGIFPHYLAKHTSEPNGRSLKYSFPRQLGNYSPRGKRALGIYSIDLVRGLDCICIVPLGLY